VLDRNFSESNVKPVVGRSKVVDGRSNRIAAVDLEEKNFGAPCIVEQRGQRLTKIDGRVSKAAIPLAVTLFRPHFLGPPRGTVRRGIGGFERWAAGR